MIVGVLQVDLEIPGAFSLKEKRSVVKGLIARIQRRHKVSVAEVADHDVWNRSVIGIAVVGNDGRKAESRLQRIANELESERDAVVVDTRIDIV